jgi:ribosomal-protein-alanine N-acetyltransferase
MRSDEEINRYTGIKKATSIEDANQFIQRITNNINNNEAILWGITLKNEKALIGTICLWGIQVENEEAEIGYVLMPQYQGKGLMQEAVMAVIDFGFKQMGLRSITADLVPANLSSIRLLERTGFIFESSSEVTVLYRLLGH